MMTLENMLRKKLADAPAGQTEVVVSHQGWNIALHPAAQDSLSCSLNDVTLQREGTPPSADPRPWAERISATVTGLLEPLKLHEVDAPRQIALLRSATPTPSDPGMQYYEVELHGTARASIRRFRGFAEPGHKREQIPFALTHEALARVIGGMTAEV
jgi:hypothetical protein